MIRPWQYDWTDSVEGDRMRCPDCNRDFPIKPEVVIQKEACKCGLTNEVRIFRTLSLAVVAIILCMAGCNAYQSYLNSTIAEKGDYLQPNGSLVKPEKK